MTTIFLTENTKVHHDMRKGAWVASFNSLSLDHGAQIGRVKQVHSDGSLDIVLYSKTGRRIGRESPVMGGPQGFEPCCCAEFWEPIEKPDFAFIADKGFYARHLTRLREQAVAQDEYSVEHTPS